MRTNPCRPLIEWFKSVGRNYFRSFNQSIRDLREQGLRAASLIAEASNVFIRTKKSVTDKANTVVGDLSQLRKEDSTLAYQYLQEVAYTSDTNKEIYKKLTPGGKAAVDSMLNFLSSTMTQMKEGQIHNARRQLDKAMALAANKAQRQQAQARFDETVANIEKTYDKYARTPYFPILRFGRFVAGVKVKQDGTYNHPEVANKTVELKAGDFYLVSSFETQESARKGLEGMQRLYGKSPNFTFSLQEVANSARRAPIVPLHLLNEVEKGLNLTPQQMTELRNLRIAMAPGTTFSSRFLPKKGVAGGSKDMNRTFTTYALQAASAIARAYSQPLWHEAESMMESDRKEAQQRGDYEEELFISRSHAWLKDHMEHFYDPVVDYIKARQFVTTWFLGANAASAVVNITQVPLATLPSLAAHHGYANSLESTLNAVAEIKAMMGRDKAKKLSPSVFKGIQEAIHLGIIDETMAMGLAEVASTPLYFKGARSKYESGVSMALWMFSQAERFNRYVSFRAAFDLAMAEPKNPAVTRMSLNTESISELVNRDTNPMTLQEARAFLYASEIVDKTQGTYTLENRPKIMQSGKGLRALLPLVTVFYMFPQHMARLVFFEEGGARVALSFAVTAGLLGLPGAEDALNLLELAVNGLGGKDKTFNVRLEARKFFKELGLDPDLVMRGLSHQAPVLSQMAALANGEEEVGEGVDLSRRLSLGRILPMSQALGAAPHLNKDAIISQLVTQSLGAPGAIGRQVLSGITHREPTLLAQAAHFMPTALRQMMGTAAAVQMGGEYTDSGVPLRQLSLDNDLGTIVFKGLGLQSTVSNRRVDEWWLQKQQSFAWSSYRGALLDQFFQQRYYHKDADAARRVLRAIKQFNDQAPQGMEITSTTLRDSFKVRMSRIINESQGIPHQKSLTAIWQGVSDTFDRPDRGRLPRRVFRVGQ